VPIRKVNERFQPNVQWPLSRDSDHVGCAFIHYRRRIGSEEKSKPRVSMAKPSELIGFSATLDLIH
jgi:hypothetical protein